jgi:hypothetical protein
MLCALALSASRGTAGLIDRVPRKPLIVFHIDMNSEALKSMYMRNWLKRVAGMGYNAVLWEVEGKAKWNTCPGALVGMAFRR